jgi:methionyl-tRNA synthetase
VARFMRLSGREVFFLSGTDEHGQKVEQSAAAKGVAPQDFVDSVSVNFRDLLELLNISNDQFIRTTDANHKAAVQHLWKTLVDKGYIYLGTYEGWYSVRDECFYTESELVDGKAPTGAAVEWVAKEESYFFKLTAFQDKLLQWYEDCPDCIAPSSRRNEVLSFVQGGLRDLSVSRTTFRWGVPVPGDDQHIMYVWLDALTNYISALGYPDKSDNFDKFWPAQLHVVGKDILRFHAVYWPAFLMAADIPLPKRLFAHGWWTKDGEKISKSLGNVICPVELAEKVRAVLHMTRLRLHGWCPVVCVSQPTTDIFSIPRQYGVDQTRFFLMAEVSFGSDGDFSHKSMIQKVNSNLANEFGNLCQRTLSLVFKNCGEAMPAEVGPYTPEDEALLAAAAMLPVRCSEFMSVQAIHKYAQAMVGMVRDANKYIDEQAPWVLRKTDPKRMATVLYVILEVIRRVAILYQPIIPTSANKILDQLQVPDDERTFAHLDTSPIVKGATITKPEGVFPRIEMPEEMLVEA